ncbi:peptide ABC transporter substrate-binding protein [Brevibacillus centrosporus]|uniref:peptide ABC transporter substrate-binding protein n=1 Tax=Brevibacillus centrosporus TaxID=54910 RepID=UPI003B026501
MAKRLIRYSLLLSLLILTACSQSTSSPQLQTNTPKESSSNTKNTTQVLTVNAKTEPSSLNPALIDNQSAGDIANQLFEGLVRVDKNGEIVPGVAEKWDISEDKTVYTFHLRQDAKWSNGEPVTADDFVYSWEKALRPDTGAPLADNLSFIKNGSKYLAGELKDPSALGMKALDPQTLQVTLERPTPFFLRLTSFFSVLPINKKVDESNSNWSGEAASFVSNGPFMMKEWKHDQEIAMVPNPQYWAKDAVKLQSIVWKMVNDQNTEYQMYQTGELDIAFPPTSATAKLLAEGKAKTVPVARTAYVRYNHKDNLFANQKIRKAFASAIDRKLLVEKVVQGGQTPATALIPEGLSSGNGDFRTQVGTDQYTGYSVEEAKKLLEEGLKELNQTSLPKVTFLTDNNDLRSKISQALQEMWKRNLGVEVEIKSMERKVFVQSVKAGEYQFALYSTGADYDDSYNLFGQFTTGDGYNYSNYSNPEYDNYVKAAFMETDPAKRAEQMIEAEKVLMNDMAINPLYYDKLVILENERVKNVYRFAVSALDLREAFVE